MGIVSWNFFPWFLFRKSFNYTASSAPSFYVERCRADLTWHEQYRSNDWIRSAFRNRSLLHRLDDLAVSPSYARWLERFWLSHSTIWLQGYCHLAWIDLSTLHRRQSPSHWAMAHLHLFPPVYVLFTVLRLRPLHLVHCQSSRFSLGY